MTIGGHPRISAGDGRTSGRGGAPPSSDRPDAALPDLLDPPGEDREGVWIAADDDEGRELPGLDRPPLAVHAEELAGAPRRRLEHGRRCHPTRRHQLKLAEIPAARRDPAVRAHRDADARLDRPPERVPMDLQHLPSLLDDGREKARTGVDGIEDALRRDERREEPCPAPEHQLDRFVVEIDAVLDRPDPGADGVLDPVAALRVGHHEYPRGRRLLDERLELGGPEVGVARIIAWRQHPTRRVDLDDVRTIATQLPDLPADL